MYFFSVATTSNCLRRYVSQAAWSTGSTPMCHNVPQPTKNIGGLPSSATDPNTKKKLPPPPFALFPKSGENQTHPPILNLPPPNIESTSHYAKACA